MYPSQTPSRRTRSVDDRELPITDHLAELRRRIAWIVVSMAIAAAFSFNFAEQIFGYLLAPATDALGAKKQPASSHRAHRNLLYLREMCAAVRLRAHAARHILAALVIHRAWPL